MRYFHVSPAQNRMGILIGGLKPRIQEHKHIEREPGVYLLETFEQAADYAFWFALSEQRPMDIWEVRVRDEHELEPDPHPEMASDFDSWVSRQKFRARDVKLHSLCPVPLPGERPPTLASKSSRPQYA